MFRKRSFTRAFRSKYDTISRLLFNIGIENIKVWSIDFNEFSSFVEDVSSINFNSKAIVMLAVLIENQIIYSEKFRFEFFKFFYSIREVLQDEFPLF